MLNVEEFRRGLKRVFPGLTWEPSGSTCGTWHNGVDADGRTWLWAWLSDGKPVVQTSRAIEPASVDGVARLRIAEAALWAEAVTDTPDWGIVRERFAMIGGDAC